MNLIDPPLPNVFSGSLLRLSETVVLRDNFEVSRFLADRAVADLGGMPITGPSEGGNETIARMMAAEAAFALGRTDQPTSCNWYTEAISRMVAVAGLLHPEITDDIAASEHASGMFADSRDARTVLFAAIAITSQNNAVYENMNYAVEQYRQFCAHGAFLPKGYGANGVAIRQNLQRFNDLLEQCGGSLSDVYEVLNMKLPMSELRQIGEKFGMNVAGKELADEIVHGSMIFGPKVGNGFMQNLFGNYEPITIDLWMMRSWGRYTGTLVRDETNADALSRLVKGLRRSHRSQKMCALMKDAGVFRDPGELWDADNTDLLDYTRRLKRFWEKLRRGYVDGKFSETFHQRADRGTTRDNAEASALKARLVWPGAVEALVKSLGAPVDSPTSAGQRRWIRTVVQRCLEILKDSGYELTAADLQALLWYPEKEIYGRLSGRPFERLNSSYDDAIARIALREGVDHDELAAALQSVGAHGNGGRDYPDVDGFRDEGPAEVVSQGAGRAFAIPPPGRREPELKAFALS